MNVYCCVFPAHIEKFALLCKYVGVLVTYVTALVIVEINYLRLQRRLLQTLYNFKYLKILT